MYCGSYLDAMCGSLWLGGYVLYFLGRKDFCTLNVLIASVVCSFIHIKNKKIRNKNKK